MLRPCRLGVRSVPSTKLLILADHLAEKADAYLQSGLYLDGIETDRDLGNELLAFEEFIEALKRYREERCLASPNRSA